MKDSHKKVCNVCMQEFLRIYWGQWVSRRTIWIDQRGLKWNGRMCGMCNRARIRVAIDKAAKLKKQLPNE